MHPEFPVFSSEMMETIIWPVLKPLAEDVCDCMAQICELAGQTLMNFVPKALYGQCNQLALIRYQMDVMGFIMETMVERKQLVLPETKANLCMFGVRR